MSLINIELVGERRLARALDKIGKPRTARKVVRLATLAAARPVARAAKKRAPKRYGQLRKSIGVISKTYPGGTTIAVIGPRHKFFTIIDGKKVDPVKYAHLVEYGVQPHIIEASYVSGDIERPGTTRLNIRHPGHKAKPFMRPAWDANRSNAKKIMKQKIKEGVKREVAKHKAKMRAKR